MNEDAEEYHGNKYSGNEYNDNDEYNEMDILEQNIIKSYNKLLKALLDEGDMDALARVITEDSYRKKLMGRQTGGLFTDYAGEL